MEFNGQLQPKRAWTMPQLLVYGTAENLTQGCDKTGGATDGYTYMGAPIQCAS